jgi:3-oxoacyl-[acyl-carrier protein] reductase
MDLQIKDRVAMVAASSKGLGKSCALALAREGCRVSICVRQPDELRQVYEDLLDFGPAHATQVDVSLPDDLRRWYDETVASLGNVDILVTNTGGPPVKRFMELDEEDWIRGVDSTLLNVVTLSRLVIPAMQSRKWGRIIHLTSLVAKQPIDELTISSTIRSGLSGLTKTMANQFGPDGITVNAILTGHILTDRQYALAERRVRESGLSFEQYFNQAAAEIPLRRLGDPQEIGDVVAFLASERASYLTGVSLQVDGGAIRSTW